MERSRLDHTLAALADPTRRAVIDLLCEAPRRAGELAALLNISAPALSRHLRILRSRGLIAEDAVERDARVRLYRIESGAFQELGLWAGAIEGFWNAQLESFRLHVESASPSAWAPLGAQPGERNTEVSQASEANDTNVAGSPQRSDALGRI
jgi:DNA-binding transcriptional ArsR family regulator